MSAISFSGILSGFAAFFSRGFWLGALLPVVIVAVLHLLLAVAFYDEVVLSKVFEEVTGATGKALATAAALIVLAYALAPLIRLFQGALDGSLLPRAVHERLRRDRARAWVTADAEYRAGMKEDAELGATEERITLVLVAARKRGLAGGATNDSPLIEAAEREIGRLHDEIALTRRVDQDRLVKAAWSLQAALQRNTTTRVAGDPWPSRLDALHQRFVLLLKGLNSEAGQRQNAFVERSPFFDPQVWQATRLGDARHRRERYAKDAYDVDFAYLWPRVRWAIEEGETKESRGLPRQVLDAAAQVDFAVLLLALTLTIPLVWLPLIVVENKSIWAFLAIGLATPPVLMALYTLVLRSELDFGGAVQTTIDRYRLAVLPMLAMPLPPTLSAERDLWRRLGRMNVPAGGVQLTYRHPVAPADAR